MGVPYFKIKDIVKDNDVAVFSSNFTLYRDISARVLAVLRTEFLVVEQYSIDEAFFTITGEVAAVEARLMEVKLRVEREVGVPVSLGVAATKTQAKYAVDAAKKTTGVSVLDAVTWHERSSTIPVHEIWGIGRKTSMRLTQSDITTVADVIRIETSYLAKLLGVVGVRLQAELRGEVVDYVSTTVAPHKSFVSSRSFKKTTTDKHTIADAVAFHTRQLAANLRTHNQKALSIRVTLLPSRHGDWMLHGVSKEAILAHSSNDTIELLEVAQALCNEAFSTGIPYNKVAVGVGQLASTQSSQPSLFTTEQCISNETLLSVVDGINKKTGRELIVIGSYLRDDSWRAKREHASPAYTTKWTDVAHVHART